MCTYDAYLTNLATTCNYTLVIGLTRACVQANGIKVYEGSKGQVETWLKTKCQNLLDTL